MRVRREIIETTILEVLRECVWQLRCRRFARQICCLGAYQNVGGGWWLLAVGCVSVKAFSVAALVRRKELQVKFNGIIQFYAYSVPRSPQADERAVLNNKTQKRL